MLAVREEMEGDFAANYHLFDDSYDTQETFLRNEADNEPNEGAQLSKRVNFDLQCSILKYVKTGFELSVICGILFGLLTTLLWWIELNSQPHCVGKWNSIPMHMQRLTMITDAVEVSIVMFWPLLIIAPICSWSMIKESNILFWCTIAGLVDIIDRCFFLIFEHYGQHWKSYVGNFISSLITFIVFYKFSKYRQKQSNNNTNTILVTLKLCTQIIVGFVIFLPYNYKFLNFYQESSSLVRTMLSCSLIALFYIPKLIISSVITNLNGIYKPDEGIVFAVVFLVNSTMVTRLTQARVESLTYFIIISFVHGICNVIDKIALPLREKLSKLCCRRRNGLIHEAASSSEKYIAHQSLVNMITETSSVIMSNAAAYILVYYYKKEESTGKREEGSILFREMVIRSSIAVCIDWFFNIIALKIQNDRYKIPVIRVWKGQWKFIMTIHLIQIIYVVVYFAPYVNDVLLVDVLHNSTHYCVGLFKRL